MVIYSLLVWGTVAQNTNNKILLDFLFMNSAQSACVNYFVARYPCTKLCYFVSGIIYETAQ